MAKGRKKPAPRRYRPRKEVKTWLYLDIIEQVKLLEYVDWLKTKKQFATVIRNGLRLMWTLSEKDTSVLFELFPWLERRFEEAARNASPPDNGELERKIADAVEKRVVQILDGYVPKTKLIAAGIAVPDSLQSSSPKAMDVPQFAMPIPDADEQDTVVITDSKGGGDISEMIATTLRMSAIDVNSEAYRKHDTGRRH